MPACEPYFLGIDWAQTEDYTAVSLLDREPALDGGGSPRWTGTAARSRGTTSTGSSGTSGTCRIPIWSSGSAR
jgi:hypothetical protein